MTVVNLKKEVVSTLKETKQTVLTAIESGNRNVFVIGDALYSAFTKCLDERKEHQRADNLKAYRSMYKQLHFGEAQGKKFMKIANTNWLRELAHNEQYAKNLPDAFTVLYELAKNEFAKDEEAMKKLIDCFKIGTAIIGSTEKSSRKLTLRDVRLLTGQTNETNEEETLRLFHDYLESNGLTDVFALDFIRKLNKKMNHSEKNEHKVKAFCDDLLSVVSKHFPAQQKKAA